MKTLSLSTITPMRIAAWAFIPLSIASVWILLTTKKNDSFHDVFVLLLWAVSACTIVYHRVPNLLTARGKRILYWCAIGLTALWAGAVRFDVLVGERNIMATSVLAFVWLAAWRWLPSAQKGAAAAKNTRWHIAAWIAAIVVVFIWGVGIRAASLTAFPLQGDEYFHANTGMGYAQTGEYVQWNYLTGEPDWSKEYSRAWPYSWQVAQSVKLFGTEEWALRLPAFLWGVLFLLLTPLVAYSITRRVDIAFFTVAIAAFDPTMIWLSAFSRMYTMLFVGVLGVAWCTWHAVRPRKKDDWRTRTTWLAAAVVCSIALLLIHEVAILLLGGIGAAVVIAALQDKTNVWLNRVAIGGIAVLVVALLVLLVYPFVDTSFITIREKPHELYYWYGVRQLILSIAAFVAVSGGLLFGVWKKHDTFRTFVLYAFAFATPILLYFVYFSNRYTAKKYIAFVLFFVWLLIAAAWTRFASRMPVTRVSARIALSILLFTWVFLPLSVPGVDASWLLKKDRSDRSFTALSYHDYPTTYGIIEANAQPGDAVVLMGNKDYYLTRTDVAYYETKAQDRLTVAELQTIVEEHEHGWIMLSREKRGLLPKRFNKYVKKNFEVFHKGKKTNLIVYRW